MTDIRTHERKRCSSCPTILSSYNHGEVCFACEERQRAATPKPWKLSSPAPHRPIADLASRQDALLEAIRTQVTGPFTLDNLQLPAAFETRAAGNLMRRAQRQGLVLKVGERRSRAGGRTVVVWELMERIGEGAA